MLVFFALPFACTTCAIKVYMPGLVMLVLVPEKLIYRRPSAKQALLHINEQRMAVWKLQKAILLK